jgi:hypothetical protein
MAARLSGGGAQLVRLEGEPGCVSGCDSETSPDRSSFRSEGCPIARAGGEHLRHEVPVGHGRETPPCRSGTRRARGYGTGVRGHPECGQRRRKRARLLLRAQSDTMMDRESETLGNLRGRWLSRSRLIGARLCCARPEHRRGRVRGSGPRMCRLVRRSSRDWRDRARGAVSAVQ